MMENRQYVHGYVSGYMAAVRDANLDENAALSPDVIDAFWSAITRLYGENLADFVPDFAPVFACQPVILGAEND